MLPQSAILFVVSTFCLVTTAAPIADNDQTVAQVNTPGPAALARRGLFSCTQEGLEVSAEEQDIFDAYFSPKDACFFETYSDEYFSSRFRRPIHFHISEETTESKLDDVKIVSRALKKVLNSLKKVEYISVSPEKQARQLKTIHGAQYVLDMWERIFRKLESHESAAFIRCFLDRDVPYKSVEDFYKSLGSLRGRLATIKKAFGQRG